MELAESSPHLLAHRNMTVTKVPLSFKSSRRPDQSCKSSSYQMNKAAIAYQIYNVLVYPTVPSVW